jgi:membrane-associated phospholipid phosphatase
MNISIKDVLKRIKPFLIIYLVLLACCVIIKLIYTKDEIYFAVNTRTTPFLDAVEPYITDLGDGWTIVILAAIAALWNFRIAFLLITTFIVTSLAVQAAKFFFDAPRPKLYFKAELSKLHFAKGVEILSHNFAVGVLLTYLSKLKGWSSVLLIFYGVMVGFSRMYLSEHFFEDVIAGSIMGVVLSILWIWFIDGRKFIHSAGWNKGVLRG